MLKFDFFINMKTHKIIDQYSHMNRKGATHNAIFERMVKNEHWVFSFWCFVSTAPNTDLIAIGFNFPSTVGVLLSQTADCRVYNLQFSTIYNVDLLSTQL